MEFSFRKAELAQQNQIWDILQQGILRRKNDGSDQWQDGYPNANVVEEDLENGRGYVLLTGEIVAGYAAILINDEPEYAKIEGKWLTDSTFVVYHRLAIADSFVGQGLSMRILLAIEEFAVCNNIYSVRADTNHDNIAMLKIFDKMGYVYCGEVFFRGSARKAYEKVLK